MPRMNYKKWKAYILSIPGIDRRANVENLKVLLESYGIFTEILDGFYYKQTDVIQELYNKGITYDSPDKTLSLSQIGCFLSHRKAWEYISREVDPNVLSIIIEDDITVLDPNNFSIDYLFEDINKQDIFHGIVLWKHPDQIKETPKYKTQNLLEFYYQWGLCVYGITPHFANILLNNINRLYAPVDQILFGDIFPKYSYGIFIAEREHFLNLGKLSSYDMRNNLFKSLIWS